VNRELFDVLVELDLIKKGTEVDSTYIALDIAKCPLTNTRGNFMIEDIRTDCIVGASTIDGKRSKFTSDTIYLVEGMEPDRFAANFNLRGNGDVLRLGKRRGRKPR
jgi:hypothetical protein